MGTLSDNLSRSSTTWLGSCYIPLMLIVQRRCVSMYVHMPKPCAKFALCPEKITQRQGTGEFQRSLCRSGFTHEMSAKDCSPTSPPAGEFTLWSLLTYSPYSSFILFIMDQRCSARPGSDQRLQWGHPYLLSPLPKF